jgi:phenylpyruvate tautomerase PptA (4-oxalocrotonate tautomerase family)
MPLLRIETTVAVSEEKQNALLTSLSRIVAQTIGKPELYVMISISQAEMLMSGKHGDAAFVDVRSIGGLNGDVNQNLSRLICQLLKNSLGISPDRVYLNFTDISADNWGWNGETFG